MNTFTAQKKNVNLSIMKSNINTKKDVEIVNQVFRKIDAISHWSVDLDDWEKVLKVESFILSGNNIAVILERFGYNCSELNH